MSQQPSTERLTRSLAYMLRHQPEEFDVEVDKFGFADLEDVLDALSERFDEDIEEEDLTEAINVGDRPRYEIVEGRIRALYGHSIDVDPGEASEPPEELYLGMGSRDADRASRSGLNAGRRRFLHLATSQDDAMEMGRRAAPEYAVVTIFARDAWEDGVSFYDRKALFLSDAIATDHIEVGEVHTDGERSDRDGRRGRGRGRGGRRDDRRGGRSRDEGRRDDSAGDRGRGDSSRGGRRDERPAPREEAPSQDAPKEAVAVDEPSVGFGSASSDERVSAPEPAPEPVVESAPEPVAEPAPEPMDELEPIVELEPVTEPESEPEPEPGASFGSGI